jgi:hypothetical protein
LFLSLRKIFSILKKKLRWLKLSGMTSDAC